MTDIPTSSAIDMAATVTRFRRLVTSRDAAGRPQAVATTLHVRG